jgi:hypothetical protein
MGTSGSWFINGMPQKFVVTDAVKFIKPLLILERVIEFALILCETMPEGL